METILACEIVLSDSLDTWYPLLDLESKPSLQRVAMEGWLSQEKIQ